MAVRHIICWCFNKDKYLFLQRLKSGIVVRNCIVIFTLIGTVLPISLVWAETQDPLVMGIFPRRNAMTTITMFKPMANFLTRQLQREVELETSKNLQTFWQGVNSQRYDIVHFNQYHYIKAHKENGYKVILKNEEFGNKSIAGAIVVRKDANIQSLADLRGKKVVFGGGRGAMISYIVPTWLMRKAGLQAGDYVEEFAKNPPHSVLVAFHKQADAAGASHLVINFPAIKKKVDTSQLINLVQSQQLASLPWGVKGSMPDKLSRQIQTLLASLKDTGEGRKILKKAALTALHPANDQEFDIHRDIVKTVLGEDYRRNIQSGM